MAAWTDKEIRQRADDAFSQRKAIQPFIDEGIRYGMPWRKDPSRGRPNFDLLFDSSGPKGVQTFSKRLSTGLTPPFQRWFELKAGPLVAEADQEEINRQLAQCTSICTAANDASNFQGSAEEMYADLSLGTGALLCNEGDDYDPLQWHAVPPWALGIEAGPSGRIDNVYWCRSYPAWQLPRKWPEANWPDKIRRLIIDKPLEKVEVLQASFFDSADRIWRFQVLVQDEGGDLTVYASRNRTNPWIVPRWWTTSGDPWGRGPLMLALPDIKSANKTVEMILKAAAYSLAPPLMVLHDGVVNPDNLRLAPNALIRVARTGGPMGRSLEPLDIGARVDLSQLVLEDMRGNIGRHLLDRQLPPQAGAVRSPTEWLERAKDFAFDTGSSFGRLNHEFVPPVVSRMIDVLDRKKVPLINFDKLKIDHLVLRVQVESPLARSQALEDISNTVRFIELVKELGAPEFMPIIVPIEDALVNIAEGLGVPDWATRTKADRVQMQKQLGAMMAQAQEEQAAAPAAGAQPAAAAPAGQPQLRAVA